MAQKIKNMGSIYSMRLEDDGRGVISTNGGVYVVDKVTAYILMELGKDIDINKIIYNLLKKYDVTYKRLISDILKEFNELLRLNFISYEYYKKVTSGINDERN